MKWYEGGGTQRRLVILLAITCTMIVDLATLTPADAMANTCDGVTEMSFPTAPNFSSVGDTIHVSLAVGGGCWQGSATVNFNRVRFNLDCNNSNLGINCPDDGGVLSYQGGLSANCPTTVFTDHGIGATPNQVVFSFDPPLIHPNCTVSFCSLEFDVRIETTSNDGTPDVIEQVSGVDGSQGDAICNSLPPLAAGNTNSGSIRLCPLCDDLDPCNGVETCDSYLGCVSGTPPLCDDGDACTDDSCDSTVGCVHAPSCNRPPDCSLARPSLAIIWPPDGHLVPVTIEGITDPDGDPVSVFITGIAQDEPARASPSSSAGEGIGTSTARLRAERDGLGDGRVYAMAFTAMDGNGGQCSSAVTVCVPHDRAHGCASAPSATTSPATR